MDSPIRPLCWQINENESFYEAFLANFLRLWPMDISPNSIFTLSILWRVNLENLLLLFNCPNTASTSMGLLLLWNKPRSEVRPVPPLVYPTPSGFNINLPIPLIQTTCYCASNFLRRLGELFVFVECFL